MLTNVFYFVQTCTQSLNYPAYPRYASPYSSIRSLLQAHPSIYPDTYLCHHPRRIARTYRTARYLRFHAIGLYGRAPGKPT